MTITALGVMSVAPTRDQIRIQGVLVTHPFDSGIYLTHPYGGMMGRVDIDVDIDFMDPNCMMMSALQSFYTTAAVQRGSIVTKVLAQSVAMGKPVQIKLNQILMQIAKQNSSEAQNNIHSLFLIFFSLRTCCFQWEPEEVPKYCQKLFLCYFQLSWKQ